MGYIHDESLVRADIFKASGKWYETISLDMTGEYETPFIHDAVKNALIKKGYEPINRFNIRAPQEEFTRFAIILEPYHKDEHPVCIWLK